MPKQTKQVMKRPEREVSESPSGSDPPEVTDMEILSDDDAQEDQKEADSSEEEGSRPSPEGGWKRKQKKSVKWAEPRDGKATKTDKQKRAGGREPFARGNPARETPITQKIDSNQVEEALNRRYRWEEHEYADRNKKLPKATGILEDIKQLRELPQHREERVSEIIQRWYSSRRTIKLRAKDPPAAVRKLGLAGSGRNGALVHAKFITGSTVPDTETDE